MAGGSFTKQGNLHARLVLGSHRMNRSSSALAIILKVYIKTLTGFSHILGPDGLNNTLLSGCFVFETALSVETVGERYIPRTGEGGRSLWLPGSRFQDDQWSCPFDGLLQQWVSGYRSLEHRGRVWGQSYALEGTLTWDCKNHQEKDSM